MTLIFLYFQFTFADKCSQVNCPANSECVNVVSGHICRCRTGYSFSNDQCITGHLYTVKGLTLHWKPWNPDYSNPKSSAFLGTASEIENALLNYFRNTSFGKDVLSVQVISIVKGSLIVDYVIIVNKSKAIPTSQIETAAKQAVTDPSLARLNPDSSKTIAISGKLFCKYYRYACILGRFSIAKVAASPEGFSLSCRDSYSSGLCKNLHGNKISVRK